MQCSWMSRRYGRRQVHLHFALVIFRVMGRRIVRTFTIPAPSAATLKSARPGLKLSLNYSFEGTAHGLLFTSGYDAGVRTIKCVVDRTP